MCPQVSQNGASPESLPRSSSCAREAMRARSGGSDFCAALAAFAGLTGAIAAATSGSAVCALFGVSAASSGVTCARSSRLRYSTPTARNT